MSDLISRQEVITKICGTESDVAREAPFDAGWFSRLARRQDEIVNIIESLPSVDTDMSDYCDRLWKIAYERGKADRPTESDLISRQAVKEQACMFFGHEVIFANKIDLLPSVDRPTGEWIKSDILPNGWHCSQCDAPVMTDDISEMLYCPNCGARMKGADDED